MTLFVWRSTTDTAAFASVAIHSLDEFRLQLRHARSEGNDVAHSMIGQRDDLDGARSAQSTNMCVELGDRRMATGLFPPLRSTIALRGGVTPSLRSGHVVDEKRGRRGTGHPQLSGCRHRQRSGCLIRVDRGSNSARVDLHVDDRFLLFHRDEEAGVVLCHNQVRGGMGNRE